MEPVGQVFAKVVDDPRVAETAEFQQALEVPGTARQPRDLEPQDRSVGDAIWSRTDADLPDLAARELQVLGLAPGARVEDGCVSQRLSLQWGPVRSG